LKYLSFANEITIGFPVFHTTTAQRWKPWRWAWPPLEALSHFAFAKTASCQQSLKQLLVDHEVKTHVIKYDWQVGNEEVNKLIMR